MNGVNRGIQLRRLIICVMTSVVLGAPGLAVAGKLGKAVGSVAGSAGGEAVGGVSGEVLRQTLAAKGISEDEFFAMAFERGIPRIKKDLPMMVDQDTQYYDVTGSGREWGYWYRYLRYSSLDFDPAEFKKEMSPEIIAQVCSKPQMIRPFMEMGGGYRYNFVGRDGKLITSILVRLQDCS